MAITLFATPGGERLHRMLRWCFPSWQVDLAVLAAHLVAHVAGLPLSAHVLVAIGVHTLASALLVPRSEG